jgi:L-malate glycosyltransferase
MRILLFIQSLELGGSETQCVEMARLLSRNSYEVTVGCMRRTGPLRRKVAEAGLQLVEFSVGSLLQPRALIQMLRLARFIRANKYDVVHANDLYSNLFAVPAARLAGVPVIVSSQRDLSDGEWYKPRKRRILRNVQGMSNTVLVNSEAIRSQLVAEGEIDIEKIRVVYNGIDVERYHVSGRHSQQRVPGIPFSHSDRLIVTVANMHRDVKGHAELIAAAQTVCREQPNVRFLLVGDGEMRSTFEAQARSMGLEKSMLFLGHRIDVADILSCCDVGVLASRAEGLPNAVMEYMAAGLAVVATPVGGVPEIIENEISGLLVPVKSPDALSREILRLLNDEPLRQRLGQAARESVISKCDFATVLNSLELIYQGSSAAPLRIRHCRETIAAD